MSASLARKFFWGVGILVVVCHLVCLASAGTSRGSSVGVHSKSVVPRASYPDYNEFVNRAGSGEIESRRSHDHHGRTLILKSLILAPLAMVVFILLLFLLIPIPVISSPLGRSLKSDPYNTIQMAKAVLSAEECVERVSCELSRISRNFDYTSWIPSTLERVLIRSNWGDRIIRGLQGTSKSNPACFQFTCSPTKALKRSLKTQ